MRYSDTRMAAFGHCIQGMIRSIGEFNQSAGLLMAKQGVRNNYNVVMLIGANEEKKITTNLKVKEFINQDFLENLQLNQGLGRLVEKLSEIAADRPCALELISEQLRSLLNPEGVRNLHIKKSNGVIVFNDDEKYPDIYELEEGEHEFTMSLDTERVQDNFSELALGIDAHELLEQMVVIQLKIKVHKMLIGTTLIEIEIL